MSEYIIKLCIVLLAYFSPIAPLVNLVIIFILIDFLSGMYASYRSKEQIVSNRLRKTLEKFVFYSVSIIVAYMFQIGFLNWCNLAQIVAGFIASTELLSIYENVKKITGLDLVAKVKEYITRMLKKK
jgi:phage-related holin